MLVGVLKALNAEAGAAKFARSQSSRGKQESESGGNDRKSSPVKSTKGVSKGG
jgi:hypothetical protein